MKAKAQYTYETEEWAFQFSHCWRCGREGLWPTTLQIHHFVRGRARHTNDLATTMILCYACHHKEHNSLGGLGVVGSLALKRRHDPAHYDLESVNIMRGGDRNAITEEDVSDGSLDRR